MWDSLLSFLFLEEKDKKKWFFFWWFVVFFYNQQGFEHSFKWSVLYVNMDLYNHGTLGVAFLTSVVCPPRQCKGTERAGTLC